ncbi:MAG: hypothetical protein HW406_1037 [Candidatus Brocadiaceae bacterium]|nr:hypothetical protein [Candidatus Brocadiaceae bacterium]
MDKVIVIDDVITEKSTDGKRIIELLGNDYDVGFINTRDALECLLTNVPKDLKLVLLDLDLSGKQMKVKAEDVLKRLVKNKIKVIILTKVPSTKGSREEMNEKWTGLAYPLKLLKRGALGYLSKIEYDGRPIFFKNCIDSIIHDSHKTYKLRLDCKLYKIQILNSNGDIIISKDISFYKSIWRTEEYPASAQDALLRIFYDMGIEKKTSIKLPENYYNELKAKTNREDGLRFGDYLNSFNNSIKEESEGLFARRLLEGPGPGKRTGIYTANIGSLELINDEQEEMPISWKESVDNRIIEVQKRLTDIEKCLKQLLQQSKKE